MIPPVEPASRLVYTRPAPSESAVYIRRIVGMMLLALGLALSAFTVSLALAERG